MSRLAKSNVMRISQRPSDELTIAWWNTSLHPPRARRMQAKDATLVYAGLECLCVGDWFVLRAVGVDGLGGLTAMKMVKYTLKG